MKDNFYEKYAAVPFLVMAAISYLMIAICVAVVAGAIGYWFGAGFWMPALSAAGLTFVTMFGLFLKG